MTAAVITLALALAVATGALVLIVPWARKAMASEHAARDKAIASERAAWVKEREERELREDVEDERDAARAETAKTAAELEAAMVKVRDQDAVIKAARAEFAAWLRKRQVIATDAEAIDIVDSLIGRRLS